jgi:kynureninase
MTATEPSPGRGSWLDRAADLDATDPLAVHRDAFVDAPGVVAYLDGNSLGRPLAASADRLAEFVRDAWGTRLIRSWDEGWMDEPTRLGDALGRVVLGAAAGQTVVGDSTSVLLYKAARAALAARPDRRQVVCSAADFPTDRFLLQGLADELGLRLTVLVPAEHGSVTAAELAPALGDDTALVLLSSVAFRAGHIADVAGLTGLAHRAGALTVWDVSHAAGVVPLELDAWGVDLAVGCGYKYLNGGPGAPAFLYAAERLLPELRQPLQGWMGAAEPFLMGERYEPAPGIRRFLSGTPSIVGMLPIADMLALIEEAGLPAVRRKSQALTRFAVDYADEELAPLGVRLASPRDPAERGSHVTLDHPAFAELVPVLQRRGVVPDFRRPDGLRIGLSPLSTSFAELAAGLDAVREELVERS